MEYFLSLLKNSITDFRRNKIRTFLTSLGILIGVLSVVLLIAIGIGLRNYIQKQFESLGANLILILPGNFLSGGEGGGLQSFGTGLAGSIRFDEKDYRDLSRISEADYVVPAFTKSAAFESDQDKYFGSILGTSAEAFTLLNLEMEEGSAFGSSDVVGKSKKVVLGSTAAEKLFDSSSQAIGKTVRTDSQRFKVVGVLKKKGDQDIDTGFIIPYKTTFGSINPNKDFFTIYLGVNDKENIPIVKKRAEDILLRRYKEDEFSVTEQTEILGTINSIFSVINGVLLAIGSISLIVGGVGIMNIMYANVTERTKEVGIRRAIGATKMDILLQFLVESVLLSLFGGLLGLLIAVLIIVLVQPLFPLGINFLAVFVAFGVSSFIGTFFGVFPARRASNLTPIEAIRYE